jgi:hypothetical protein
MTSEQNHLKALKEKHKELDELIYEKYKNYAPDDEVDKLKFEKLFLKREIERLESSHIEK